jgi:hypothetical protein
VAIKIIIQIIIRKGACIIMDTVSTETGKASEGNQLWTLMQENMFKEIMDASSDHVEVPVRFGLFGRAWPRDVSAIVRRVCKAWRDIHDQLLLTMCVDGRGTTGITFPSDANLWRRFTRIKSLRVWNGATVELMQAIASSLTGLLSLSLDIEWYAICEPAARGLFGLLAPLTALRNLELNNEQDPLNRSPGCLRSLSVVRLARFDALTSLDVR